MYEIDIFLFKSLKQLKTLRLYSGLRIYINVCLTKNLYYSTYKHINEIKIFRFKLVICFVNYETNRNKTFGNFIMCSHSFYFLIILSQ